MAPLAALAVAVAIAGALEGEGGQAPTTSTTARSTPAPVVHMGEWSTIAPGVRVRVRSPHAVARGTALDVDERGGPVALAWVLDLPDGRLVPALEPAEPGAVTFPAALADTEGGAVTATGAGGATTWRLG